MMRNPQPNWASSLNVTNMGLGNHCDSYPPSPSKQPRKPRNKHKTTSHILPKCKKKSRKKQQNCISFKKPRVVPVTSPIVAAYRLCEATGLLCIFKLEFFQSCTYSGTSN